MLNIDPIELKGDAIAFVFDEHVNARGMFDEVGNGTIIIANNTSHKESASRHRWGTVIKTGPMVKDPAIVPGAHVLIGALRWSLGVRMDDSESKFHVTNEREVIAIEE